MGQDMHSHRNLRVYQMGFPATETQVWLERAVKSDYLDSATGRDWYKVCDNIPGKLVTMISHPERWGIGA